MKRSYIIRTLIWYIIIADEEKTKKTKFFQLWLSDPVKLDGHSWKNFGDFVFFGFC